MLVKAMEITASNRNLTIDPLVSTINANSGTSAWPSPNRFAQRIQSIP